MDILRAVRVVAPLLLLGGCGDGGTGPSSDADATPPGPPDASPEGPFAGRYDGPEDFPSGRCVPGSMAGFTAYGMYRGPNDERLVLRPRTGGGVDALSDLEPGSAHAAHLDDDHLLVRAVLEGGTGGAFTDRLQAIHLCARGSDGSLSGHIIECRPNCPPSPSPITFAPLGRLAGETDGEHLELVSAFFGDPDQPWSLEHETYQVRVRDGIAYVGRDDGLHVVDVHDPARPVELARIGGYMNDLKVFDTPGGRRYVVAATNAGASFFDVTTPAAPFSAGAHMWNTGGGHSVFVEPFGGRTRLYLVDGFSQVLDVLDVTDPTHAALLGTFVNTADPLGGFHDLYVDQGIAYVNNTFAGVLVLDTRDLAHVQVLADEMESDGYCHASWLARVDGKRVLAVGDEFADAHLRLVDVEPDSPTFMQNLGEFQTRPETSIHNFMVLGTRAYIAYYEDGVRVVDIADPAHPRQVGYYNTFDFAPASARAWALQGAFSLDVDPAAQLVYVTDSARGLVILRETP